MDDQQRRWRRACRDVGHRVRELRQAKGWTQEDFAEKLEIEGREVRRIEAGRNLTIRALLRLADALSTNIPDLFQPPKSRPKRKPGRPPKQASEEPP